MERWPQFSFSTQQHGIDKQCRVCFTYTVGSPELPVTYFAKYFKFLSFALAL